MFFGDALSIFSGTLVELLAAFAGAFDWGGVRAQCSIVAGRWVAFVQIAIALFVQDTLDAEWIIGIGALLPF